MDKEKINSLEESNQLEIGNKIPTWNPFFGLEKLNVSENSKDKISVIEIGLQVGNNYLLNEYEIEKSKIEFFKDSLALANFKKNVYTKEDKNYKNKLKIAIN